MYKDLKATHVFLDKNMKLTLIDFGHSEQLSDGSTTVPAGTLHAMSPEMLILFTKTVSGMQEKIDYSKESITLAHDYYTLGVLILELIDHEIIKYFKNDQSS